MPAQFRLDYEGIGELLKSAELTGAINELAEAIAANVRTAVGDGIPVEVDHYVTDRGAAAVTIADLSGLGLQARDGVLTRAASAAGLEVKAQ